jgi:hypothetical protein
MRRLLITLLVSSALLLSACGDDADSASDDAATTTTTPAAMAPEGPEDGTDDADEGGCASVAEAAMPAQAERSFPDNPHNEWTVASSSVDTAGRAFVEAVPTPDDVGYPRFQFVSNCAGDEAVLLGAYALDDGVWVLLFTTDDADVADFEPTLG